MVQGKGSTQGSLGVTQGAVLGLSHQALLWVGSLSLKVILDVAAAAGWLFQEECRCPSIKPLNSALGCEFFT